MKQLTYWLQSAQPGLTDPLESGSWVASAGGDGVPSDQYLWHFHSISREMSSKGKQVALSRLSGCKLSRIFSAENKLHFTDFLLVSKQKTRDIEGASPFWMLRFQSDRILYHFVKTPFSVNEKQSAPNNSLTESNLINCLITKLPCARQTVLKCNFRSFVKENTKY